MTTARKRGWRSRTALKSRSAVRRETSGCATISNWRRNKDDVLNFMNTHRTTIFKLAGVSAIFFIVHFAAAEVVRGRQHHFWLRLASDVSRAARKLAGNKLGRAQLWRECHDVAASRRLSLH